jgi:hypothetical protein
MSYLYAIHDPWFYGMADGDVDDRAAFCAYEEYLSKYPDNKIIAYVGERYDATVKYYGHFRLLFRNTFDPKEISAAEKIMICAPVQDPIHRNVLTNILSLKQNGYCQGCKIGCMNFPNKNYLPLLDSIPVSNRLSTLDTMIPFPMSFVQRLDPYYTDYLQYGFMKLISPGAIAHIPGLLYRLYCPEIGGGPGTNMLTIQRCLQKHFCILTDIPVDKDHFIKFNKRLIQEKGLMIRSSYENEHLSDSITVMMYFANLIYKIEHGNLYEENTPLYSLNTLPPGRITLIEEESPPLYDLVAAHAVLYGGLPTKKDILDAY